MAWDTIEIDGRELAAVNMTPTLPVDTKQSDLERHWCEEGARRPEGHGWFLVGTATSGETLYARLKFVPPDVGGEVRYDPDRIMRAPGRS